MHPGRVDDRRRRPQIFHTLMDGAVTRGFAEIGAAHKTAATPDTPLLYQLYVLRANLGPH
jgi:hypothetical protein